MHRRRLRSPRPATALVAAVVVAFQALLATWPPAAGPGLDRPHQVDAAHHAAGHHDHHVASDETPTPSQSSDHHARFCCVLGGKLGTAIGPAPSVASLAHPVATAVASLPSRAEFHEVFRPLARPLGARAPPAAI